MSLLQTPTDDQDASRATGLAPARSRRPGFHPLTVSRVDRLTATSVAVSFAVPPELAEQFAFEPGQHLTLRATIAGEDVRRSYSICISRPEALRRKEIRVGSAVVDGGRMSTWLNTDVAVGDVIQVMSPLGTFTRPERDATSLVEGQEADGDVSNESSGEVDNGSSDDSGDEGTAGYDLTRNTPDVHDSSAREGAVDRGDVQDTTAHHTVDEGAVDHGVAEDATARHATARDATAHDGADRAATGRVRHHVAVAAGSGITPVLSIAASTLEEHTNDRVTLIYGNRRTDSVMFLEELEDLKNAYPSRFHLMLVLSREVQDVELFNGRIDSAKLAALTNALVPVDDVDDWYLCGPFGMVEDARIFLSDKGVERSHIHHEIFHVDEPAAPASGSRAGADVRGSANGASVTTGANAGARGAVNGGAGASAGASGSPTGSAGAMGQLSAVDGAPAAVVTVNLDGRTTRIEMANRSETILEATLRERPDAPYSCTGGVCGTCRARVVTGEVTMDRCYALEPEEIAAGLVLACQAHPVTDEVALDYDA